MDKFDEFVVVDYLPVGVEPGHLVSTGRRRPRPVSKVWIDDKLATENYIEEFVVSDKARKILIEQGVVVPNKTYDVAVSYNRIPNYNAIMDKMATCSSMKRTNLGGGKGMIEITGKTGNKNEEYKHKIVIQTNSRTVSIKTDNKPIV